MPLLFYNCVLLLQVGAAAPVATATTAPIVAAAVDGTTGASAVAAGVACDIANGTATPPHCHHGNTAPLLHYHKTAATYNHNHSCTAHTQNPLPSLQHPPQQ